MRRSGKTKRAFKTNRESGLFNEVINFQGRVTYNDFFNETKNYPNDINILANTDIYFNETINLVREMGDNDCYCITRWEEDGDEIVRFKEKHTYNNYAKEAWSQDVWIIKGVAKKVDGYFNLGVPGCDNRIAHELHRSGYRVINPCDKIQCIHRHKEQKRAYTISGKVPKPYKFIEPNGHSEYYRVKRKSI
jgi:hypothetical protein